MSRSDDPELLTLNGTPLPVAVSALIKSLRRGRELEGLFWALQIERRYPKYLWRKLCTFAAEDVGIANPQALLVANAGAEVSERHRTGSRARRNDLQAVAFCVLYLARSAKNREGDQLLNALSHLQEDGWEADVPAEARDLHTRHGEPTVDELRFWFDEASRVEPEDGPMDWKLWMRRWAVRQGVLDADEVEADARRWDAEGRLRYGVDGP